MKTWLGAVVLALLAAACGGSETTKTGAGGAAGAQADAAPDTANAGAAGSGGAAGDAGDASEAGGSDATLPDGATGSCTGAPGAGNDCGPANNESCCASLPVTGGTFSRSYDGITPGHQDPSFVATVSDFSLDRFEVTVGRFRAFVEAYPADKPKPGDGAHPKIANSGWQAAWDANLPADATALAADLHCTWKDGSVGTWTDAPGANEKKPIACVEWYLAFAFCAWDGGRLPTEAEWNYAAAGGSEQLVFPFSPKPKDAYIDPTLAVFQETSAQNVGSRSPQGDNKWGQADLIGNVSEWVLDWYADAYPLPCLDCAQLGDTGWKSTRGGAFGTPIDYLSASDRAESITLQTAPFQGFRCARW